MTTKGPQLRTPLLRLFGVEFLWRALSEPRRLGYRYFVSSWGFLGAVWRDLRDSREIR
jgi:N-acetylglucosaminyldiphosphoundecaprenol N-acetyl-beta-D-mannosaminyltransferase